MIDHYRYGSGCRGPGLWIGATRYPPRAVPKTEYRRRGYFDLRLPLLAPSAPLVSAFQAGKLSFAAFAKKYRREMQAPAPRQMIALIAAAGRHMPIHLGCFCSDPARCHRSLLLELVKKAGQHEPPSPSRSTSPVCYQEEIED